jgi:hypothetical protein
VDDEKTFEIENIRANKNHFIVEIIDFREDKALIFPFVKI